MAQTRINTKKKGFYAPSKINIQKQWQHYFDKRGEGRTKQEINSIGRHSTIIVKRCPKLHQNLLVLINAKIEYLI